MWYAMLNTSHCRVLFIVRGMLCRIHLIVWCCLLYVVCYVEYISLSGVVYCMWYAMLNTSHCRVLFIVRGMLC